MTELFSTEIKPKRGAQGTLLFLFIFFFYCSLPFLQAKQQYIAGLSNEVMKYSLYITAGSFHVYILKRLNSGRLKVTHQHTPWSRWRCAGLEGRLHNISRCVNTSPPYILCKNCDWNMLHSCLFYILKDTGETKTKDKIKGWNHLKVM